MTPRERYREDLLLADFESDPIQSEAISRAEHVYRQLVARRAAPIPLGWFRRSLRWSGASPIKGLYLWGEVGRGKTYVMDALYECCPFQEKRRVHFHSFMQQVHRELKTKMGVTNPLEMVAQRLAREAHLLCLDELHVGDITDAMLLAGLFRSLFNRGVTLVATSNDVPDRLYWNGLQRERFLPAIELIKRHTEVFRLAGPVDYRLRTLERAEIYHTPLDPQATRCLTSCFERLARGAERPGCSLHIDGRAIPTVRKGKGVIWFEFDAICGGPRGPSDYLEIALCYHSVLISNIPSLGKNDDDKARRLITLVDALYDRNVKLIVSAQTDPAGLYYGERLAEPFRRTVSRLEEMQSHAYLAREHLP